MERDGIEAWWDVAWDEHTAEAGWSGKVTTSIGSSNLGTDD